MSGDLEGEQSESHNDCLYCKIENKVPSDGGMVEQKMVELNKRPPWNIKTI